MHNVHNIILCFTTQYWNMQGIRIFYRYWAGMVQVWNRRALYVGLHACTMHNSSKHVLSWVWISFTIKEQLMVFYKLFHQNNIAQSDVYIDSSVMSSCAYLPPRLPLLITKEHSANNAFIHYALLQGTWRQFRTWSSWQNNIVVAILQLVYAN